MAPSGKAVRTLPKQRRRPFVTSETLVCNLETCRCYTYSMHKHMSIAAQKHTHTQAQCYTLCQPCLWSSVTEAGNQPDKEKWLKSLTLLTHEGAGVLDTRHELLSDFSKIPFVYFWQVKSDKCHCWWERGLSILCQFWQCRNLINREVQDIFNQKNAKMQNSLDFCGQG